MKQRSIVHYGYKPYKLIEALHEDDNENRNGKTSYLSEESAALTHKIPAGSNQRPQSLSACL